MSYTEFNGTLTQYKNLHHWVGAHFGKPSLCDGCKRTDAKRYDWACLNGQYDKERSHWKRLCRSCHQKMVAILFVDKRFAGKKHTVESKAKTSATLKKFWAEHPEKYQQVLKTKAEKRRLKNVSL